MTFLETEGALIGVPSEGTDASSAPSAQQVGAVDNGAKPEARPSEVLFGSYRILDTREDHFDLAVRLTREAESEELRVNELCWRSQALVYATGCHRAWAGDYRLEEFCRLQGIAYTKRTQGNRFLPLVKAVHIKAGRQIANKDASRYARALQYLASQNVRPAQAYEFLRDHGGISGCLKLASDAAKADSAPVEAPVVENDEAEDCSFSPRERELIAALRLKGVGSFVCHVVRDVNGMQRFTIDIDAEADSIAAFDEQGAEAALEAA